MTLGPLTLVPCVARGAPGRAGSTASRPGSARAARESVHRAEGPCSLG